MRNQGDTIKIILDYTVDGEPITEGQFDEIEFTINDRRYTLTGGGVEWDGEYYVVHLSQAATFAMPKLVPYQLRLKIGNDVISTEEATLEIGESLSRIIL